MSRFMAERYKSIVPYRLGDQPKDKTYIKLNSNESSIEPVDAVYEALEQAAHHSDLSHYSDQDSTEMREAISRQFGISPEESFVGNGGDEVISFVLMAFAGNDGVVFPDITYCFYKTVCSTFGLKYREIPLDKDFRIVPEDFCNTGSMVIIANPNAPTGLSLSVSDIEQIVASNRDHVVAIDEAYVDFGTESVIPLIKKYDNLVVIHTMSKSYNIAGVHVGYAIGSRELMQDLNDLKNCFNPNNVNQITLDAAVAAMNARAEFIPSTKEKIRVRAWFTAELEKIGFSTIPSKTNFVYTRYPGIIGSEIEQALYEHDILVRYYNWDRVREYVRISIGSQEQMSEVVKALKEIIPKLLAKDDTAA